MPYPHENPTAKHDFMIFSEDELPKNASDVFKQLDSPIDPEQLRKNSTIYTYRDGPQHPGPISRSLIVVGLIEMSSDVVQRMCFDPTNDVMHKCTLAVKMFNPNLPEKDKSNSMSFAKFVTRLRREQAVAVLSKDRYGRFGIMKPMEEGNGVEEKFAADCYIGDIEKAKALFPDLSNGGGTSAPAPAPADPWAADTGVSDTGLWQPPGTDDGDTGVASTEGLWQPPGNDEQADTFNGDDACAADPFSSTATVTSNIGKKRSSEEMEKEGGQKFHRNTGAATADAFYSGLTRTLDTRSESRLYHMRAFNGWVKATQIQELNPQTIQQGKKKKGNAPMRVLDLACGKGGDLGKWILHPRKMSNYVGVDVARGSLKDAAVRARAIRGKLGRCTFTCADLGYDVPGRLKSPKKAQMQKLLSWSLQNESEFESGPPEFHLVRGGGVSQSDKFDVVSIQFAIHYMLQTRQRARRFFRTVSELLEIGGNLIATTIDARVVIDHLMDLGEDLHFDSEDEEEQTNKEMIVKVGAGACQIRFQRGIVKKIFKSAAKNGPEFDENVFGLEYTFTLREGSDHAAGVGEAVDLPEWLTPLPVLKSLAEEAGLELEYGQNFHEFYQTRKDPQTFPAAHLALYNMKVLNRDGSISNDEWEISRLYCAVKFRKVREAQSVLEDESDDDSEEEDLRDDNGDNTAEAQQNKDAASEKANAKFLMKAMLNAKMTYGKDQWESLSGDEKKRLTQIELQKLVNK